MKDDTLYVLDFNRSEVHIYKIEPEQSTDDVEEFIIDQDHNLDEVQYMFGPDITIIKH